MTEFQRGTLLYSLNVVGESNDTVTTVTVKPDPDIYNPTTEYNYVILSARFRALAYLN